MSVYIIKRDGKTNHTEHDMDYMETDILNLSGGVVKKADGDLKVVEDGSPSEFLTISAGRGYIPANSYSSNARQRKLIGLLNTADVQVEIAANASGLDRIDIVVAQFNSGTSPDADGDNDVITFEVVEGTPDASPSAPATPANALLLAEVDVANGFSTITDSDITDKRIEIGVNLNMGWQGVEETWTYASADSPSFVVTVASGATERYTKGMRVRLDQGGTIKYFLISYVTDTTITLYGGTDYTLANETIIDPRVSMLKAPVGFPLDQNKWTETYTRGSASSQSTPTASTWYNLGGSISVPIGDWIPQAFFYMNMVQGSTSPAQMQATISDANNTESETQNTIWLVGENSSNPNSVNSTRYIHGVPFTLTSKATRYLNARTRLTSTTSINIGSAILDLYIKMVSALL